MTKYQEQLNTISTLAGQQAGDKEAARIVNEWMEEYHAQRVGETVIPRLVRLPDGTVDTEHNIAASQANGNRNSGAYGDKQTRA